jgi:hypothetical protein
VTTWCSSDGEDRSVAPLTEREGSVAPNGMWHVTLTVGGVEQDPGQVLEALERLADERPFLLSGRYGPQRAELRYWEEAADCSDACALALRLWGEHRQSAQLPAWSVCGLEVLDREEHQRRDHSVLVPAGSWRPF